jgi:hypothetical protein
VLLVDVSAVGTCQVCLTAEHRIKTLKCSFNNAPLLCAFTVQCLLSDYTRVRVHVMQWLWCGAVHFGMRSRNTYIYICVYIYVYIYV